MSAMDSEDSKPRRKSADEIAYGRTPKGQCLYDVLLSSMSAAAVNRKYPDLSREFVLKMRREFNKGSIATQRKPGSKL